MHKKILSVLSVILWFALLTLSPAQAYLDPGNGSLMLQLVLGGVAGLLALLRVAWDSFKSRLLDLCERVR